MYSSLMYGSKEYKEGWNAFRNGLKEEDSNYA